MTFIYLTNPFFLDQYKNAFQCGLRRQKLSTFNYTDVLLQYMFSYLEKVEDQFYVATFYRF